jgi:predicted protein tyrosine phosphatase
MSELPQKMRVLFVCRQNKVRSLTAEHLYRVRPDLEVRSAGTANFAKNQLTNELLTWADLIFVFDETQSDAIETRFGPIKLQKRVVCLDLPDVFEYKSKSLVVKLTAKLEPYLGRPNSRRFPTTKSSGRPKLESSTILGKSGRSIISQLLAAVGVATSRKKIPD